MVRYLLKEGDHLDLVVFNHYGQVEGAVQAVMELNAKILHLFDNKGKFRTAENLVYLLLPKIAKPIRIQKTIRIFD